jgi:hypothetical protein
VYVAYSQSCASEASTCSEVEASETGWFEDCADMRLSETEEDMPPKRLILSQESSEVLTGELHALWGDRLTWRLEGPFCVVLGRGGSLPGILTIIGIVKLQDILLEGDG